MKETWGEKCSYVELIMVCILRCSYRENSSLGDPNTLVEELLQIRNKIRIKEADVAMVKGKVRT